MTRATRWILLTLLVSAGLAVWFWLGWLEQSYDPPYSLIEDGLYLGSSVREPPPGTQAVVNLCGRPDPYKVDASLWEPILEGGPQEPDLPWLKRVVAFISEQRDAGRTTYIHCMNGVNRSAFVTIAYLMAKHGLGRDEAFALVRARRPMIQPNPELLVLLDGWADALREDAAKGAAP